MLQVSFVFGRRQYIVCSNAILKRERYERNGFGNGTGRGGGAGAYLESNDKIFLRIYIYIYRERERERERELGYADIYDHIIQYDVCSLGRIGGGRKE